MKLKIPAVYGQRNSQWASIILGNNTDPQYTIGLYGCTITALGDYIGKTPEEINILLTPNGFQQGSGEIIWGQTSLIGLNQQVLSYRWSDLVTDNGIQQAQQLLDQGYPLLCEVDFNPATTGEEMHFVLCIGYDANEVFYIADPWTGDITTFDKYGGFRRAVIQFRAYDVKLSQDTTVDSQAIILAQSDAFIAVATKLNLAANKDLVLAELDKLITIEDQAPQKDKQLSDAQGKINFLQTQLDELQTNHVTLTEEIATQAKTIQDQDTQIKTLDDNIQKLKEQMNQPVLTGWKLFIYKLLIGG